MNTGTSDNIVAQNLSEIIEACGDDIHLEINVEFPTETGLVRSCRAQKVVKGIGSATKMYWGLGKTVEEAVAMLYLDINKK